MGSGESAIELDFSEHEMAAFHREHRVEIQAMVGYDTIDERLGLYQDLFQHRSPQPDICKIDTIWPGALADDLIDLTPFLEEELTAIAPELLRSFTVDGRLVGVPIYIDTAALYYRTDLLRKYGYAHPPGTWDELGRMAAVIQRGERAAGNRNFWGFLWQGVEAEALTCNALEWQMSEGGGDIIEDDGTVSLANEHTRHALERAASWVGSISPPGVVEYDEDDSRTVWQTGNAAFLRDWLDAYGQSRQAGSAVRGRFATAPLPAGAKGRRWTFGGMALGVSKYSQRPAGAVAAVRHMVTAQAQRSRARVVGHVPSRTALLDEDGLLAATAFNGPLGREWRQGMFWRPSAISGSGYDLVSRIYAKAVHDVLTGRVSAAPALEDAQRKLCLLDVRRARRSSR
jgi:trehalose/maltose transport system substrate-binding protein